VVWGISLFFLAKLATGVATKAINNTTVNNFFIKTLPDIQTYCRLLYLSRHVDLYGNPILLSRSILSNLYVYLLHTTALAAFFDPEAHDVAF
jgi:hypothetical protein